FESLSVFSPYYNTPEAEYEKCVMFESGLRSEVKHLIGFLRSETFQLWSTRAEFVMKMVGPGRTTTRP
ncbi:hypothetical protein A2U01_0090749, partial [Trifolium medium]|nr:hypothetical protein [Trifolium medium]